MRDPRFAQIAVLAGLATWGVFGLDFEVVPAFVVPILGAALATEWCGAKWAGKAFQPWSPLISGLSLVLLLRTDQLALAIGVAVLAVASKYVLRVRGKHVFNPTNFALVVALAASNHVWISPGQWGSGALAAAAFVAAAAWVLRSARGDVTVAFVACWAGLLFGRALWLGDPLAIPGHQLQNGALLLFAGFMISDPRTLPDARGARVGFAAAVAGLAFVWRFAFHEPDALLFALATCAPLSPVLDHFLPGARFEWRRPHRENAHVPTAPTRFPRPAVFGPRHLAARQ